MEIELPYISKVYEYLFFEIADVKTGETLMGVLMD